VHGPSGLSGEYLLAQAKAFADEIKSPAEAAQGMDAGNLLYSGLPVVHGCATLVNRLQRLTLRDKP